MRARLFERLAALERRVKASFCRRWDGDEDHFITALGVEAEVLKSFERRNADGSTGYDLLAILNTQAQKVWNNYTYEGELPRKENK